MAFRLLGSSAVAVLIAVAPAVTFPDAPARAQIGIGIGVGIGLDIGFHVALAPPALPVYVQPPLPAIGYIWVPGYWHYGDFGYYWVPGTWVQPPSVGLLWTPGYWGFQGGFYGFHAGYWGPHVGFYGGINYGFGYTGSGFFGGSWRGGVFAYNQAYNNFGGVHVTNVYNQTVVVNHVTNVSYNGPGGVTAQPTPQERTFATEPHTPPTATQIQHVQMARANPALRQSVNHGAPAIAATQRPAEFKGPGVVPAHAAAPAERPAVAPAGAHPAMAAAGAHPAMVGAGAHPAMAAAGVHPSALGPRPAASSPLHPAGADRPAAQHAVMPNVVRPGSAVHPTYAAAHRAAVPHPAAPFHPAVQGGPHPGGAPARPAAPRAPAPHPAAARPAGHPSQGRRH
jgi:hypothetical protein